MPETERTRLREWEAPSLNAYEMDMAKDKAWAERQQTGRIVVRRADTPQELMRQAYLRYDRDFFRRTGKAIRAASTPCCAFI